MKILPLIALSLLLIQGLSASCMVADPDWKSNSTSCKEGFVDGKATAFHRNGKLKFEGEFKNGSMSFGTVFYKNKPYYIGPIVDHEMHGQGICYFKKKPEKCEYYKGSRVDTIFKLRFLMRQQLLAIQGMLQSQQDNIEAQARSYPSQSYQPSSNGNNSNSNIGSKVLNKVGEKVMDKILDNFF